MARWMTIGLALAAATAAPLAAASGNPVILPGGEMDQSISDADVFVGRPEAATAGDNPACQAAKNYFDVEAQGRYADLATLFTPDAVFLDPLRQSRGGRLDIADFYKNHVSKIHPTILIVSYAGLGMDCYVETAVQVPINGQPRWVFSALDQFTVNAQGKIDRFIVFVRPRG